MPQLRKVFLSTVYCKAAAFVLNTAAMTKSVDKFLCRVPIYKDNKELSVYVKHQ